MDPTLICETREVGLTYDPDMSRIWNELAREAFQ